VKHQVLGGIEKVEGEGEGEAPPMGWGGELDTFSNIILS
jgi:hypothetical protein